MTRDYAVFLRGISNVPMEPFRSSLAGLGLEDVTSFGASGNFVFSSSVLDCAVLERRIAEALGASAFLRSRSELAALVEEDPFAQAKNAAMFLARRPFEPRKIALLESLDFEGERPVAFGNTIFFVHPTRLRGRKTVFDFERELGAEGTMRASRVIARVLSLMEDDGG